MTDPPDTRMFAEAAEAAAVVARQLARQSRRRRRARRPAARRPPARVVDLRARQFRPCRDLRQISDRDPCSACRSPLGRAFGRLALSCAQPARRRLLCLAISQSGRSPDLIAHGRGGARRAAPVSRVVNDADSPLAELADMLLPLHAGAGDERGRDQELYRRARRASLDLVAAWARGRRARRGARRRARSCSIGRGRPTGRRWSRDSPTHEAFTSSAAASASASRRKRRSSSRRPAAFMPRRSARPRFAMARWRWSGPISRCWCSARPTRPRPASMTLIARSARARRARAVVAGDGAGRRDRAAASTRASGDRADPADPVLLSRGQCAIGARAASIPIARRICAR